MKKIITMLILSLILLMAGCEHMKLQPAKEDLSEEPAKPLVGGDKDEYGCIPSAGYVWCESKQKCLRLWEEDCPGLEKPEIKTAEAPVEAKKPIEKEETAEKEIPRCTAGYEWCETLKKCIMEGEECPTEAYTEMSKIAEQFIGAKNVAAVYICGPYIKVVSKLVGAGATYHSKDLRKKFICPVIAPDQMTEECKQMIGITCFEVKKV